MSQIPTGRSLVQAGEGFWLSLFQFFVEKIAEEMMIAEPLSPIVQRDKEEVFPFQRCQYLLCVFSTSDRLAQGTTQTVQDTGLQQKLLRIIW
jgi:hypothetical protein